MNSYNAMIPHMEYSDYDLHFWNAMRGKTECYDRISRGRMTATSTYAMAPKTNDKCMAVLKQEGLFRQIGTLKNAYRSACRIWTKVCDDFAVWVPEGGEIPMYDGMDDFTRKAVDSFKLAAFTKTDLDFARDADFDFEDHLIHTLAKVMARAEDNAFINGTGKDMPTGILAETGGAEIGVTDATLSYENVENLFLSVKPEYRRKGVWIVNDETAIALRKLKDADGNNIWNHSNDTILGHKVMISEFMPNVAPGSKPIAFGDFSYYWLLARSPVSIRPIVEMFADRDQIGHLAIEFMDGKLIRTDAVKVLKIAE